MPAFEFRYFDRRGGQTVVHHTFDSLEEAVDFTAMLFDSERVELWHDETLVARHPRTATDAAGPRADGPNASKARKKPPARA